MAEWKLPAPVFGPVVFERVIALFGRQEFERNQVQEKGKKQL